MNDVDATVEILHRLKAMKVGVSMDDFGTGHSSLNHLRRFPFDIVKIDQSFVRDICRSTSGEAIIRAVIAMAHALELRVIAEGVETEEQREFLTREGCEEMQGFLVSPPVPLHSIEEQLQRTV
jgi:EAL domain-containing protein (putative c-di-GMP-specific phosphodiesterase class I)